MPHNRWMPTDRRVSPLRAALAVATMVGVMLLVAALGEWLLIPAAWVRDLDEGGVARATGLLAEVPWLEEAAVVWSDLTTPVLVHAGVLVVALALLTRGRVTARALLVAPIGLGGWGLGAACKELVQRPRPAEAVVELSSWSYPSGHSTNIALGTVLLIALLRVVRTAWIRWGATTAALVVVVLTAADRLVLGVHHPSDVAAGLVLGTAMALIGLTALHPVAPPGAGRRGSPSGG